MQLAEILWVDETGLGELVVLPDKTERLPFMFDPKKVVLLAGQVAMFDRATLAINVKATDGTEPLIVCDSQGRRVNPENQN